MARGQGKKGWKLSYKNEKTNIAAKTNRTRYRNIKTNKEWYEESKEIICKNF